MYQLTRLVKTPEMITSFEENSTVLLTKDVQME